MKVSNYIINEDGEQNYQAEIRKQREGLDSLQQRKRKFKSKRSRRRKR
jgi:hypothetical protein